MNNQDFSYFKGKRILITGAGGYLGANLTHCLKDVNCTIIRLSRDSKKLSALKGSANVADISGSICDREIWGEVLAGVDIVYHFAAQTSVYVADKDALADLQNNVVPMLNLLETCRSRGWQPVIIFSGTATEVGIPESLPVNETHKDCPVTVYDIHKLMAENYLKHYSRQGFVQGATLRLSNVYGPGPKSSSNDRGVINMMVDRALKGEPLTVYGQGNHLRDYIYVDDVISAFLKAPINMKELNGRHFVIGSGQAHTIAEAFNLVAERVAAKTGKRVTVNHIAPSVIQSPIEGRNFVADSKEFIAATGWHHRYSLSEGIGQMLEML
jgi:nucleoside-diphosphate-sugar epimerase